MDTIKKIAELANKGIPVNDGDYIGEDGLLYCGKCHTKKQVRFKIFDGTEMTAMCLCKCQAEARDRENEERKKREEIERIGRLKTAGFADAELMNCTFERDDRENEKVTAVAKRYVEHFAEFRDKGKGLVFYGGVGTGKTFIASCIANALMDKWVPCLVTNFARLTNTLQGMYEGKQEYIDSLNKYDLLVIDDLASERDTEYMNEIVYNIVDARYRSGKPMIVTTNLSLEELKNPDDIRKKRIYSRIVEMCVPIPVGGKDRRKNLRDMDLIAKLFAD